MAAAPPPPPEELPFGGSPPGEPIWPAPSASLPSERPIAPEGTPRSSAEALLEEPAAAGELEAPEEVALQGKEPEGGERGDAQLESAVAGAPAEPPLPPDPPGSQGGGLEQAIDQFLGAWSRSVVEKDYSLHRELGFSISESEFELLYGRREALELSFVRLDHSRPEPGAVNVKVLMAFGYRDRTGFHRTEKERDIVLRETASGSLSYAGSRE